MRKAALVSQFTKHCHNAAAVVLVLAGSTSAAPIIWGNNAGGAAGGGFIWLDAYDMDPAIGAPNRVAAIKAPVPGVDFPNGRGIAVVGDLIYYSRAYNINFPDGGHIYVWNTATNSFVGTIDLDSPPDGVPLGGIGTITWDGSALWVSPYDAAGPDHRDFYRYSTSGQLLQTIPDFFDDGSPPGTDGKSSTDGVEIVGNRIIANRGDHTTPYDVYDFNGNLLQSAFIDPAAAGLTGDTAGIAFDGTSYWLSDLLQSHHQLFQFDANGNYVRTVVLSPELHPDFTGVNLEDLAFAAAPEPGVLILVAVGGAVLATRRRRV
jgi:hypothetical protein